ncbi:hypothetical protein ACWDZ4_20250 [Streptomyces sp. NPDC003016]
MAYIVTLQFKPPIGPCVTGWWDDSVTAEQKWREWVGTYGSHPTARIQLVEQTADGEVPVKCWPQETGEVRALA